jgi:hypothetical protein
MSATGKGGKGDQEMSVSPLPYIVEMTKSAETVANIAR